MVTLNDIAAKLGISKSTVSKGLNNASDVSGELRQKILETAAELGYSSRRGSKKVCILIENMGYQDPNQFGYDFVVGFQEMARSEGLAVDVVPLTEEYQRGVTYQQFMSNGAGGARSCWASPCWTPGWRNSAPPPSPPSSMTTASRRTPAWLR